MCSLRWQYKATKAQLKSKIEVNGTNRYSIALYGTACFLNVRPLFRSIRASRLSKFLHHKLWKSRLSRFVAWNLVFTTAGLEAVLKTWHDNAHSPADLLCIRKVYLKASLIANDLTSFDTATNENDKIPQRRQGTELFPWSSENFCTDNRSELHETVFTDLPKNSGSTSVKIWCTSYTNCRLCGWHVIHAIKNATSGILLQCLAQPFKA